ncbi:MAG: hypothetical protein MRY32_01515 [Rickettsiales bacterium]|nr:hypothetical protein [Rickettsiales bacterium]
MPELPKNPLHNINDVQSFEADDSVSRTIGKHVSLKEKVFTPEKIAECQQLINDAMSNFFEENASMLTTMVAQCDELKAQKVDAADGLKTITTSAFTLKSQADSLSFKLVSDVSGSLSDYCHRRQEYNENVDLVIRKHIDTLKVAFANQLEGDGGEVGAKLFKALQVLVSKNR